MKAETGPIKALVVVNEDLEIVIPSDEVRRLSVAPGSHVIVKMLPFQEAIAQQPVEDEESKRLRHEHFLAVLKKYQGTGRQDMLDAGYASVDEMMADIRPEW